MHKTKYADIIYDMTIEQKTQPNIVERPPIIVIMGHIDHGKTKILDYIRKTKVAEKTADDEPRPKFIPVEGREAGGITQSVGAYEITYVPIRTDSNTDSRGNEKKRITFIDTPGHEAFSKMRSRGAQVADIAVLVIATDEGIKPQTKEAYAAIKEAGIPFLVALNKIDKSEADPNRVKKELAELGIATEGWGGDIPCVLTSAKTGQGIDELLDTVIIMAEMEELKGDANKPAYGIIIESHLDSRRGITATLIIKDGTIKQGDLIRNADIVGKIKILEDFQGKPIKSASFSSPVRVVGFKELPQVGEEITTGDLKFYEEKAKRMINVIQAPIEFLTGVKILAESKTEPQDKTDAENTAALARLADSASVATSAKEAAFGETQARLAEAKGEAQARLAEAKGEAQAAKKSIHLILKADVSGSLEALEQLIKNLAENSKDVEIEIIKSGLGDISENDINIAASSEAFILAFNVGLRPEIKMLAQTSKTKIIQSNIIYKIIEELEMILKSNLSPEQEKILKGELEILAIFGKIKGRRIIGGKVTAGKLTKNARAEIWRQDTQTRLAEAKGEAQARLAEAKGSPRGSFGEAGEAQVGTCKIINLQEQKQDMESIKEGKECGLLIDTEAKIETGDMIRIY